jgi:hypothetical protein
VASIHAPRHGVVRGGAVAAWAGGGLAHAQPEWSRSSTPGGNLLPDPRRAVLLFTDTIGTTAKQLALADLDVGPLDFLTFADADNTP